MKKLLLLALIFTLAACKETSNAPGEAIVSESDTRSGTVTETITVADYLYIKLDENGRETWLATAPTTVNEGDTVEFIDGAPMSNFRSNSLDRTFEEIWFVDYVNVINFQKPGTMEEKMAVAHGSTAAAQRSRTAPTPLEGEIEVLEDGTTIAGILADYQDLEGQQVSLRARVVKFNPAIMGKNWALLQDGTGTAPHNALMAITTDMAEVGDTVTVTATVAVDVDLGYGYDYRVLLENASLQAEEG